VPLCSPRVACVHGMAGRHGIASKRPPFDSALRAEFDLLTLARNVPNMPWFEGGALVPCAVD
jgi:hypothetical protein